MEPEVLLHGLPQPLHKGGIVLILPGMRGNDCCKGVEQYIVMAVVSPCSCIEIGVFLGDLHVVIALHHILRPDRPGNRILLGVAVGVCIDHRFGKGALGRDGNHPAAGGRHLRHGGLAKIDFPMIRIKDNIRGHSGDGEGHLEGRWRRALVLFIAVVDPIDRLGDLV